MKPLHLSGWGVKIAVQDLKSRSELVVTDGREDSKESVIMRFKPRRFPHSSIVIDGHSGYISLRALHWLSRNKVPVFVMNYDGSIISSILPPAPIKADLRAAQFQATNDPKKKFNIAHALVKVKITRSLQVLDWLAQRYDIEREVRMTKREALKLSEASTVGHVRTVEGRVALRYWEAIRKILPEWLDFQGRMTSTHQNNASDPFNAALNYGYGFLESECRMAINVMGLEPAVGFLHEFSSYQTKHSLAYDLQEPFRWLVDLSVVQAFESKTLDLRDFYFTCDDYRYRFELDAKQRFIDVLRERFNVGVAYKGRRMKWDTVILEKTSELGKYLTCRSSKLDFAEPAPILERRDNRLMREKILSLTHTEAKKRGIGKSTLHYLHTRAINLRPFKIYQPVRARLP
ncbi:MAG: CRISPR-associated endonuclease Cas1 [Candidatus Bathyarchaeia archaeon]